MKQNLTVTKSEHFGIARKIVSNMTSADTNMSNTQAVRPWLKYITWLNVTHHDLFSLLFPFFF